MQKATLLVIIALAAMLLVTACAKTTEEIGEDDTGAKDAGEDDSINLENAGNPDDIDAISNELEDEELDEITGEIANIDW